MSERIAKDSKLVEYPREMNHRPVTGALAWFMVAAGLLGGYLLYRSSMPLGVDDHEDQVALLMPGFCLVVGIGFGWASALVAAVSTWWWAAPAWLLPSALVWYLAVLFANFDRVMPVPGGAPNLFAPGPTDLASGILAWTCWTGGSAVGAVLCNARRRPTSNNGGPAAINRQELL